MRLGIERSTVHLKEKKVWNKLGKPWLKEVHGKVVRHFKCQFEIWDESIYEYKYIYIHMYIYILYESITNSRYRINF
jgi:hypothetical protein